jgi:hypothetical protein
VIRPDKRFCDQKFGSLILVGLDIFDCNYFAIIYVIVKCVVWIEFLARSHPSYVFFRAPHCLSLCKYGAAYTTCVPLFRGKKFMANKVTTSQILKITISPNSALACIVLASTLQITQAMPTIDANTHNCTLQTSLEKRKKKLQVESRSIKLPYR